MNKRLPWLTWPRLRRPPARHLIVLVAVGLFVVWLIVNIGGVTATTWVDDLGEAAAAITGAVACTVAARRLAGRDRLSWALIAASCATWAGGQLIWSWYELIDKAAVPFPSLADLGFLGAVPFMIAGLLTFPRLLRGAAARLTTGADGLIIAVALLTVSWVTTLGAVYAGGSGNAIGVILSLAYPITDIAIVTMALLLATRARATSRAPLLLLAAGVAALGLADSSFAFFAAAGSFGSGTPPLDSAWVAGFLLVALAGSSAAAGSGSSATVTPLPSGLRVAAPYVLLVIASVAAAWRLLADRVTDRFLLISVIVLVVLVVAKQVLLRVQDAGLLQKVGHDALTGLPNRDLLHLRINEALDTADSTHRDWALLLVDLDDFAGVIDRVGRGAADSLLVIVASRLQLLLRPGDLVAHLSRGRFAVLLGEGTSVDNAVVVARRVQEALEDPVELDKSRPVSIRATIGLVSGADGGCDANEMVRRAEIAVAMGNATGSETLVIYDPTLEVAIEEQLRWRRELEAALEADQFRVHYQPIVDMAAQRIVGVEALLRWQHPRLGLLPPGRFISDLERTGLIVDVGAWVLRAACQQVMRWRTETGSPLYVTVNASGVQLQRLDFEAAVRAALALSDLPPHALTIELTESVLVASAGAPLDQLRSLRSDGVRLALDDFGTDYSSLTYLRQFPVDVLKIDKSFVDRVTLVATRQSLTKVLLDLGTALGLTTVAEGVESREQHDVLIAMGCRFAQGYYYSRPVPASGLVRLLAGGVVAAA